MVQELVFDPYLESRKNLAWWLYVFHGASLVFSMGLFSFIPLIISYVKRPETSGTFVYSHHSWQIRSFWWFLVWSAIGWLCIFTIVGIVIGIPILAAAWIWKAYRLIRGIVDLGNNKPMPT
ncbi:membrane protein [Noviherbaspirillum agri]